MGAVYAAFTPLPQAAPAMPPTAVPLLLGPFAVDRGGGLRCRADAPAPALRFAWRDHPCEAELLGARLRLTSVAGRIPFSAEPPRERAATFAAFAALSGSLPAGWLARLLPDHRIRLETEVHLADPTSPTALVAELVRFALALDPTLDRLAAAGAKAPCAGPLVQAPPLRPAATGRGRGDAPPSGGTVNTWPG